jgi:hypothetical protein
MPFFQNLTIELTDHQSDLLKNGFAVLRKEAELQLQMDPKLGFVEKMRLTNRYAFTGGWLCKLDGKAQTITLKGKSEFRYFIEMVYLVALTIKRISLEQNTPCGYEIRILEDICLRIADQGDVSRPAFGFLTVNS